MATRKKVVKPAAKKPAAQAKARTKPDLTLAEAIAAIRTLKATYLRRKHELCSESRKEMEAFLSKVGEPIPVRFGVSLKNYPTITDGSMLKGTDVVIVKRGTKLPEGTEIHRLKEGVDLEFYFS